MSAFLFNVILTVVCNNGLSFILFSFDLSFDSGYYEESLESRIKMKIRKKIIFSLLGGFLSVSAFAGANQGDLKTTAKLEKYCSISSDNLNFGVVQSPLVAQQSSSQMAVFCNKNTAYSINLSYGGVYGQGGVNSAVYTTSVYSSTSSNGLRNTAYKLYKDGVWVGSGLSDFACDERGGNLALYVSNQATKDAFKVASTGWQADTIGICSAGVVSPSGLTKLGGAPAYDYGIMKGLFKGNNLAYKITLPSDSSKVWNQGKNTVAGTGNGEIQYIPLNGQIVPAQSSSLYVAQDSYLDIVTATITY